MRCQAQWRWQAHVYCRGTRLEWLALWWASEWDGREAVSALMTANSLATQTMNIGYVREHIYTAPRHPLPVSCWAGARCSSLNWVYIQNTGDTCCHEEGVKSGGKRWKLWLCKKWLIDEATSIVLNALTWRNYLLTPSASWLGNNKNILNQPKCNTCAHFLWMKDLRLLS